jgi:large subunit ribosomal protein L1
MKEQGKRYITTVKELDKTKAYTPQEAVDMVKKMATAKFDETVELHLRMGLDPRNSAQQVRGVALLPYGLGKQVRVLVFAQGEAARTAEQGGADFVGADDLVKKIEEGWAEFDIAIATPDMMSKVGKLGRVLGRKGLMPNPKSGTVVPAGDLAKVLQDARKGRVEFKLDRTAIVHVVVGKSSFDPEKLVGNLTAIVEAIIKARPAGAKGQYVRTAYLTSSMGPSVKLDLKSTLELTAS